MSIRTNRVRAARHLRKLGWRVTSSKSLTQAIKDFQRGYTRRSLKVDGVCGNKTLAAIIQSSSYRSKNKVGGTASRNFDFKEFRCKCGGRYKNCRRIWVDRRLIVAMEKLRRTHYRSGMVVISGCRCQGHNKAVGGASSSQHTRGTACDITPVATLPRVRALRVFSGLGYARSNNRVCHVDVRYGGSRSNPAVWEYSNW